MFFTNYILPEHSWYYDLFYNWQTLIAGAAAVIAALATVWVTKSQIRESKRIADATLQQAEKHEERRWKSKRNAARAVMPLSLTALMDYSESCAEFLMKVLATKQEENIPRNEHLVLVSLPFDAIKSLQNVIELTEGRVAKHLAILLAKLQIQHSRMRNSIRALTSQHSEKIVLAVNIESHLIDAAIISAFTSSFFEYARFEKNEVSEHLPYDEVFRCLRVMGIHEHQARRLYEALARRKAKTSTVDLGAIKIEEITPLPATEAHA